METAKPSTTQPDLPKFAMIEGFSYQGTRKDRYPRLSKLTKKNPRLKKFLGLFKFFLTILGYCPNHGFFMYPYKYATPTEYENEEDNYEFGCHRCQAESEAYWADMWLNTGRIYEPSAPDRSPTLQKILNLIKFYKKQ